MSIRVLPAVPPERPGPVSLVLRGAPAASRQVLRLVLYGTTGLGVSAVAGAKLLPSLLAAQGGVHDGPGAELRLLVVVALFGGLGGLVHMLTSLAQHAGHRTLARSWILWYYARPPVGALLAVAVYSIMRMGMASPSVGAPNGANVYGVLALSFLTGLCARQALDRLAEAFDPLFGKTGAAARARRPAHARGPSAAGDLSLPPCGRRASGRLRGEEPVNIPE